MEEQSAPVAETVAPAPPIEVIDVVDTPQGEAPAEGTVVPPVPQAEVLYAGKYRTPADLERGYKEAERMASEKAQEAAMFRRVAEERMAQPSTPQYAPQPQGDFNEKLREELEKDTAGTLTSLIEYQFKRMYEQQQQQQRDTLNRFNQFAAQPGYAEVMNEAATQLPFAQPIDPTEGVFLRARIAKLEKELSARSGGAAPTPQFAEPARGASRPNTGLRVEVEGDVSRLRNRMGAGFNDAARMVAKHKAAGGTMDSYSIDDWSRDNA